MNREKLQLRRLGENDKVLAFNCGDEDLNDFILTDAPLYYHVRLATSYVLEDSMTGEVAGYFSLAHDRISLTDFPSNSAYNRFRKQFFARGKMFKSYPALKICRLATNKAGCRFVTVDAYADALPFYYKMGFAPLSKEDEGADTRLLFFDLETVKEEK